MTHIPRHDVYAGEMQRMMYDRARAKLDDLVDTARLVPALLPDVLNRAMHVLAVNRVLDEDPEVARTAAAAGAQAAAALFASLAVPAPDGPLPLGAKEVPVRPTPRDTTAHAVKWLFGTYLACIARDQASRDLLCAVPLEALRELPVDVEDYAMALVGALQAFFAGADLAERVDDVATAAEASSVKPAVVRLTTTLAEALPPLAGGDGPAFSDAIDAALRSHAERWSAESGRDDYLGYVALGPLALLCIAHDRGLAVTVTSDYAPAALIG